MEITLYRNETVQLSNNAQMTDIIAQQKYNYKVSGKAEYVEAASGTIKVVDGSTETLAVAGLAITTGRYFRVETNYPVTVSIDGGVGIPLVPPVHGDANEANNRPAVLSGDLEFTISLAFANNSGQDAIVRYIILGD